MLFFFSYFILAKILWGTDFIWSANIKPNHMFKR